MEVDMEVGSIQTGTNCTTGGPSVGGGGLRHQHGGAAVLAVLARADHAQQEPHHVTGSVQTGQTAREGVGQGATVAGGGHVFRAATGRGAMITTNAVKDTA